MAPGSTRLTFRIAVDRDGGTAGTSAGCDDAAAAHEGRAGGDHRFPWRWQVINQKREVGVQAADDSEPVTWLQWRRNLSKLTDARPPG